MCYLKIILINNFFIKVVKHVLREIISNIVTTFKVKIEIKTSLKNIIYRKIYCKKKITDTIIFKKCVKFLFLK